MTDAIKEFDALWEEHQQAKARIVELSREYEETVKAGNDEDAERLEADIEQARKIERRLQIRLEPAGEAADAEKKRRQKAEADRLAGEANAARDHAQARLDRAAELAAQFTAAVEAIADEDAHAWRRLRDQASKAGAQWDDMKAPAVTVDVGKTMAAARRMSGVQTLFQQYATPPAPKRQPMTPEDRARLSDAQERFHKTGHI